MAENSKIEWTRHTWNPWVGCTALSPACDHCYAEGWAKRTGQPHLWQGIMRAGGRPGALEPPGRLCCCSILPLEWRLLSHSQAGLLPLTSWGLPRSAWPSLGAHRWCRCRLPTAPPHWRKEPVRAH